MAIDSSISAFSNALSSGIPSAHCMWKLVVIDIEAVRGQSQTEEPCFYQTYHLTQSNTRRIHSILLEESAETFAISCQVLGNLKVPLTIPRGKTQGFLFSESFTQDLKRE